MSEPEIMRTEKCFFETNLQDLQVRVGTEGGKIACGNCAQVCELRGREATEGVQLTTVDAAGMLDECNASFETRRKINIAKRLIMRDGLGDIVDDDLWPPAGDCFLFLDKPLNNSTASLAVGYSETLINDRWQAV